MSSSKSTNSDLAEGHEEHNTVETKRWYRSSMFNACVIGMVGFMVSNMDTLAIQDVVMEETC